jgi:GT2 family glycosyltransferase
MSSTGIDLSIIIVSYNASDYLRRCLKAVEEAAKGLSVEVFVVDNLSSDNSCQMVENEFPQVGLLHSQSNLGFAAANNLAIKQAKGRYILLLNSDAFVAQDGLRKSIELMDATPKAGAAGARLLFEDGSFQVSARLFPTILTDFFSLAGLAAHFPKSRLFGGMDRSWDDPMHPARVGWVTGAYMLLRASVLEKIGLLDEEFYFYYEDIDLCSRIHDAGYEVWYWPQIEVVHVGGGSASQLDQPFTKDGALVILWRMRSMLLYYRKHQPAKIWLVIALELTWYWLRGLHNRFSKEEHAAERYLRFRNMGRLLLKAWHETDGGRKSPARPW